MYYVKTCPRSVDDAIAVGRWWPGSASGGAMGGASGSWVCVRISRVSASGQAAVAARNSRNKIRLG